MVESYAEGLNKSIEELEIDKEFDKFTRRHMSYTFALFGFSRDESCHQTVSVGKYSQTFHGGGKWQR